MAASGFGDAAVNLADEPRLIVEIALDRLPQDPGARPIHRLRQAIEAAQGLLVNAN
jgi:hypothetical protein